MDKVELEKIMRIMNIPECHAHTLSQLYIILEKESYIINNLRNTQDIDSLFVFIKSEYEVTFGEELKLPKFYLKMIL